MIKWFSFFAGAASFAASTSLLHAAEPVAPPDKALSADVVFLGEQHDNPAHHELQAAWVSQLAPAALVFEMLTIDQANLVTADIRRDEALLEATLDWSTSGWPDFSMYFPIFEAAPEAAVFGAGVPRDTLQDMMEQDLVSVVGAERAARFGLDAPLPADQQTAREALQRAAHCNALPEEFLPRMVAIQRVRDAALAQAVLDALQATGGPVAVITGNGHAREDWGAPFLLKTADAALRVFTLGQGEASQIPDGGFSLVADGPAVDRGNPCDVFNK